MPKYFFSLFFLFLFTTVAVAERLPRCEPAEVGLDTEAMTLIDAAVDRALAENKMPGCVVCIGRHGKIALLKAYGNKQVAVDDKPALPMTVDTVFDLASLTKPVATATAVMVLRDQGKLAVDDPVARFLPEFDTPEKKSITLRQLLLHTAGFVPDLHIRDFEDGEEKAWERILAAEPVSKPGEKYVYSDVSFQVLGKVVEKISGQKLDEFCRDRIFKPLGMNETAFNPGAELSGRAAPTQNRELGKVHDPRAFLTGGVSGHAGLFSTADDLAVFASMMLRRGEFFGGIRILETKTVEEMIAPNRVPGGYRALGWDKMSGPVNRPLNASPWAFGHGGFTGTALWADPAHDLFVIFLSNRVHPDGKGEVNRLAGKIGTIAIDAILEPVTFEKNAVDIRDSLRERDKKLAETLGKGRVLTGLDHLVARRFEPIKGKRVGVVTNHTGWDRNGVSIVKLLHDASEVELVALFSPEHGLAGLVEGEVGDDKDSVTGLTVHSLYGRTRRPTPEMLDGIEVLVFDIQDIGARFYTYISTMLHCMEAVAMKNLAGDDIEFVILDRPNPIRGDRVAGPVTQPGEESFVGCHPIALRHGMTVGELAQMFNAERRLDLVFTVIPCVGWERSMDYEATGLPWVNPSPNMRSLTAAYLYPGSCLPEGSNMSVGRGTDWPFELVGAPWVDGEKLAAELREASRRADLDGIRYEPCEFTPMADKFKDEKCGGVRFLLDDRENFNAVRFGIVLVTSLRKLYPNDWDARLDHLLLRDRTRDMILRYVPVAEIEADWQADLQRFEKRRARFLFY